MISWKFVEAVYLLDVMIFFYLFYYFFRTLKRSKGEGRIVIKAMAILAGVLFLQELYFGANTLTDPSKLAILPEMFPFINSIWIYAKIILTIAGIFIIYTLMKLRK